MNKKGTPPGGDKHDYLSLSIYYWPDPAKADGKPYIVRDGEINPESKTDFYDKSSLDGMLSAVKTLSLAYYFTGEEKYGIQAANLLRTWFISPATRMNPNMDYSQGIPGKPGSRASGIIESVGFLAMLDYPALLTGLKEWTPADQLALQTWFLSYLNWLQTSPTGKAEAAAKNNHGAWYDAQTAMYALFSGDLGTASSVLKTSTPARIAAQIEPDGRQPLELARTRSLHYSLYNLQAFINQAVMGQKTESNLWRYSTPDGRSIRKALDFVLPYLNGQKWEYPEMGTQDYTDFAPYLYLAGAAYNEKSYTALADTLLGSDLRSSRLKLLYAR